jgi:hypothetical protein
MVASSAAAHPGHQVPAARSRDVVASQRPEVLVELHAVEEQALLAWGGAFNGLDTLLQLLHRRGARHRDAKGAPSQHRERDVEAAIRLRLAAKATCSTAGCLAGWRCAAVDTHVGHHAQQACGTGNFAGVRRHAGAEELFDGMHRVCAAHAGGDVDGYASGGDTDDGVQDGPRLLQQQRSMAASGALASVIVMGGRISFCSDGDRDYVLNRGPWLLALAAATGRCGWHRHQRALRELAVDGNGGQPWQTAMTCTTCMPRRWKRNDTSCAAVFLGFRECNNRNCGI